MRAKLPATGRADPPTTTHKHSAATKQEDAQQGEGQSQAGQEDDEQDDQPWYREEGEGENWNIYC